MIHIVLVLLIFFAELKIKASIDQKEAGAGHSFHNFGIIRIRRHRNYGAFLNLGEHSRPVKWLSCIFTLFIACLFILTLFQHGNRWLKLGLSFLLGGAFSNTYDRLSRSYVVDYFSFNSPWKRLNRIVFNLSDFAILIGSLLLVLSQK